MREKKKYNYLKSWRLRALLMACYDAIAVSAAYFFALLLRFDFRFSKIPEFYYQTYIHFLPYYIAFCLVLFWVPVCQNRCQ